MGEQTCISFELHPKTSENRKHLSLTPQRLIDFVWLQTHKSSTGESCAAPLASSAQSNFKLSAMFHQDTLEHVVCQKYLKGFQLFSILNTLLGIEAQILETHRFKVSEGHELDNVPQDRFSFWRAQDTVIPIQDLHVSEVGVPYTHDDDGQRLVGGTHDGLPRVRHVGHHAIREDQQDVVFLAERTAS